MRFIGKILLAKTPILCSLAVAGLLLAPSTTIAHTGHPDAPGSEDARPVQGPVEISAEARKNLELQTEAAELRPVQETFSTVGRIAPLPKRSGTVSTRISGRVTKLFVQEGEVVTRGQPMVEVESRQLGTPPPRVTYGSPIAGVITDRHVVLGESVEPNSHLFEIADLREVYAIAHVFEGQIGLVQQGAAVRVQVDSYPNVIFEGTIERKGGALDEQSRSLKVFSRIANPDAQLIPGMTASITVVTSESDLGITVPKSAILGEFGRYFAFVEGDNPLTFERRDLVLGLADDRYQEILEGILPGEEVVVRGNYQLQYVPPSAAKDEEHDEGQGNPDGPALGSPAPGSAEQRQSLPGSQSWPWVVSSLVLAAVLWFIRRTRGPGKAPAAGGGAC